jgi:hypothetical protein
MELPPTGQKHTETDKEITSSRWSPTTQTRARGHQNVPVGIAILLSLQRSRIQRKGSRKRDAFLTNSFLTRQS